MRTTIDIDGSVLRELKRRARAEGKTLGTVASELLAGALAAPRRPAPKFRWRSGPMGALVDLEDKDAVYSALDEE